MVQGVDGNFYGTTNEGGSGGGSSGTAFKITPSGAHTTLYNFCALYNCADGSNPTAGLIEATDGNFYGTTSGSNAWGSIPGTVFELNPGGALNTLYSFCSLNNCDDGYAPFAGLIQDTDGKFYGTAEGGGTSAKCSGGCGTVFSLDAGLGPFVETLPTIGRIGQQVIILGSSLTGATNVTFNGTAATFTVASSTEITASVPNGATTGKVQVMTPSGVLTSNVVFGVR